jgi:hypothetical protein
MTQQEFSQLLNDASQHTLTFARRYVETNLSGSFRYHVLLNQSFDGNASETVRVFSEDDGREYSSLSADEVVKVLLRESRCPEWIDIAVEAASDSFTLMRLLCCGRFTDDPKRFYYTSGGTGPFGIKSPNLPIDYREGVRFPILKI